MIEVEVNGEWINPWPPIPGEFKINQFETREAAQEGMEKLSQLDGWKEGNYRVAEWPSAEGG